MAKGKKKKDELFKVGKTSYDKDTVLAMSREEFIKLHEPLGIDNPGGIWDGIQAKHAKDPKTDAVTTDTIPVSNDVKNEAPVIEEPVINEEPQPEGKAGAKKNPGNPGK